MKTKIHLSQISELYKRDVTFSTGKGKGTITSTREVEDMMLSRMLLVSKKLAFIHVILRASQGSHRPFATFNFRQLADILKLSPGKVREYAKEYVKTNELTLIKLKKEHCTVPHEYIFSLNMWELYKKVKHQDLIDDIKDQDINEEKNESVKLDVKTELTDLI